MAQSELLIPTTAKFKIIVKTGSKENKITGFDEQKKAWKVEVNAPPEKNKANIEIIRFLTKEIGKKVKILSGLKFKEKICEIQN